MYGDLFFAPAYNVEISVCAVVTGWSGMCHEGMGSTIASIMLSLGWTVHCIAAEVAVGEISVDAAR